MSPSFSATLFWIAATICIVAQVAVLRASVLGRTPGAPSPGKTGTREIAWAVLPALMLAATLFFSWRAVDSAPDSLLPVPTRSPLPAPSSLSVGSPLLAGPS